MLDLPMAADLRAIMRAERVPLTERELAFYDWQLREAIHDDLRATHGKNGTPALRAIEEE